MNTPNRRRFLTTTLTAAPTLAMAAKDDISPIDAHVHVWTPDTDKFPLAEGFDKSAMQPPSFTPEELFAQCRPHGVERIVLIQMSFYRFDNSYMLQAMREHPGAFGAVAIVDETQPNVATKMKELAKQGVRGFRLYAFAKNVAKWDDTPGMLEMWKTGGDENLAMCLLADPDVLPTVDKFCARFPKTPVVVDHFARIGMRGAVDQAQLDQLLALARFPRVSVKTSAFYALGAKKAPYTDLAPMIRQLRDAFGAERLMWATDCPYQVQGEHTYAASIALIRDKLDFLSAEDTRQILEKTAERLFFPAAG